MADALVGPTIQIALEKVVSFATNEIGMFREFKKDLGRLKETMEMIWRFVGDAEEKQVKNPAVIAWLKRLEALACLADHVLDEVNYEMIRRQVEDRNWFKSKVNFFSSPNPIFFRLRMARKLKDINTEFELINNDASKLGLQLVAAVANTSAPSSDTGPLREKVSVVGHKVIGRDDDESKIVDKLLSHPNEQVLTPIPIIGMGGIGKTTLARSVYNNGQILGHFKERIWVSVPKGCEPSKIFRLILKSWTDVENLSIDNMTLDVVVQKLKKKLEGKQYLLVLDDVWSGHDEIEWGEFLECLRGISTSAGSCIVATTREVEVALIFCAKDDHVSLRKLSDEHCLDIVKEKAPLRGESVQDFEANIKKLCQGLPLVARVIGGLLSNKSIEDCRALLEKGISMIGGEESHDAVEKILKLSFDRLPSPFLKKCFTYCSLFEKASIMEKKELIQLWMAQGFLQPADDDDMEIGNKCINSLLGSCLLEEVIDENGECEGVRMHDLLYDLAQSILKPTKNLKDVKEEDHSLVIDSFGEEIMTLPKMRMLRTLFVQGVYAKTCQLRASGTCMFSNYVREKILSYYRQLAI